jgi:hypothetical protein
MNRLASAGAASVLGLCMMLGSGCSDGAVGAKDAALVDETDGAIPNTDGAAPNIDGAASDASSDANGSSDANMAGDTGMALPAHCTEPRPNQPPDLLSCTGLYGDFASKALSNGVREFKPAVELWSDGAGKSRWIYLPDGATIDVSKPDAWTFPVGTKFWKEFRWKNKRIETRLFWKVSASLWVRTAYKWNADDSEAERTGGEDLDLDGDAYHIPSTTECDRCHGGRPDKSLGFEAILLGLPGATGVTLDTLKDEGLLSGGTLPAIALGDDGTGHGAEAQSWLHVNCGVSCHNGTPSANAYSTDLRMRLHVSEADGSSTHDTELSNTTIDVATVVGAWPGTRIIPGNPDDSWLYKLMSSRDPVNMSDQMPPIASRLVPQDAVTLLHDWITALGGGQDQDGGP